MARVKCKKCGNVFEYEYQPLGSLIHLGPYKRIRCPACGKSSWFNVYSSVKDPVTWPDKNDAETLDLFNNAFRFGTMMESGIRIQFIPLISVNAGYEREIVFPRHLFWKSAGSMAIEWAGIGAIDFFVSEVMDDSPAAGPIINFVLKSGLSYGLYQLRRDKMNWPFESAEPLTLDSWRFGITFTF